MTDRKIFRLQILDLATEHFLVLSAAVLITAVVAGTMFLFGYLASFDWRLIFIIEYADILKISLIFVGALSTIIVLVAPVVSYLMHGEKRSPARLAIAAAMIIALLVALVFEESRSPDPRYAMLFIVVSNTFLAIALVAVISRAAVDPSQQPAPELIGIIVLALPAMLYFGWGFGIVVRDSPGFNDYEVTLKDYEVTLKSKTLAGVGLVMITSETIVLTTGHSTVVVPASEVLNKARRREHMIYQILFLGLSVVIAANILIVVIALTRAYREERRGRRFSGFAPG